jgi:flagellar protein FlgJ
MRAADLGGDELFGSEQGNFYRDLYDQQLSQLLAKQQGLGLADVLVRQLGGERLQAARAPANAPSTVERAPAATDPASFTRSLWPHAERAGRELGVAPEAIVAVAALETGWGSALLRRADGASAHNLFGIKADARWDGERVTAVTREVVDGRARSERATFRAYDSVAAGVDDYVQFLKANPRYREALAAGGDAPAFVRALGASGYATDPAYGRKLEAILDGAPLRTAVDDVQGRTSVAGDRKSGATALKNPDTRPIPA